MNSTLWVDKNKGRFQCNLCGFSRGRIIINSTKSTFATILADPVRYVYCKRCGFLNSLAGIEYLIDYAHDLEEQTSEYFLPAYRKEMSEAGSATAHIRKMWPSVDHGENRPMLDVGSGAGGALVVLREYGWTCYGVEPGLSKGPFSREHLKLNVKTEFYSQNSFESNSFDFIYSRCVIEHVAQPYNFLRDIFHHLKPGGVVYLETPNALNLARDALGGGHISMFTPATLRGAVNAVGFEIFGEVDRSDCAPFADGIALVARKPETDLELSSELAETRFIPVGQIRWKRDNYFLVMVGWYYALKWGRSGDVRYMTLPIIILKLFSYRMGQLVLRNSQLKRPLARLARRLGYKI